MVRNVSVIHQCFTHQDPKSPDDHLSNSPERATRRCTSPNRSPRRYTRRHSIAMASTAKTPIPCHMHSVLVACVHGARLSYADLKPGFRCRSCVHARCVLGPCLHEGRARAACVGGGSRDNCMGAGGRCLAPRVGCVRWSGPARNPAHM
jgi:hypothetical protein